MTDHKQLTKLYGDNYVILQFSAFPSKIREIFCENSNLKLHLAENIIFCNPVETLHKTRKEVEKKLFNYFSQGMFSK